MIIDFLCNDGSPLGVSMKSLWGKDYRIGVGGSEYLMLTLCELWTNKGHTVVLYNDPPVDWESPFEQRSIASFDPKGKRDVLINFRSPNERTIVSNGYKVWLSCDQYSVGDYARFSAFVDKIVCISPFHVNYFQQKYGIGNAIYIDIPIRLYDFDKLKIEKVPKRLIFNSVPDRGLEYMRQVWGIVKPEVSDVSLVITSDYRLWGADSALNERHRVRWIGDNDVQFLGALSRDRLLQEQAKAVIHSYPCIYDELFCVALAETQCMNVYPVSNDIGALKTTNMGMIIEGNPQNSGYVKKYADKIIQLLNEDISTEVEDVKMKALKRFAPEIVLNQWDENVFNGHPVSK